MNQSTVSNNKLLVKNSLMLYLRMFVNMGVSLLTSRLILNALGETDFGIYNVVGGIVVMFTFINGSMNSSTSRFLTVSLAKGNSQELKATFSFAVTIHAILAFIILLLAETFGLWFFYHKMIIPAERMDTAFILYQLSIITTMLSIMSVPYNSSIISHEKMNAFAYISISDVVFKLLIVYIVIYLPWDKLLLYALLLFITQIVNQLIYIIYCQVHFEEAKYSLTWNKKLFVEMCGFAGWNMTGNFAFVCYTQGLNLLINMFFGPSVNAARGIAIRVQGIISNFASNFQTAIHPQITKNYAVGNYEYMQKLIFAESKFSLYLLLLLSLPVLVEAQLILNWWLVNVPENTVVFLRIMLFTTYIETTTNPLLVSALATGNVKKLQLVICPLLLCILPLSYLFLKFGAPAYSVFIVNLLILFLSLIIRVFMLKPFIGLSPKHYFVDVIIRCMGVGILSSVLPISFYLIVELPFIRFLTVCLSSVLSVITMVYFIGMNHQERLFAKTKIRNMIKNRNLPIKN